MTLIHSWLSLASRLIHCVSWYLSIKRYQDNSARNSRIGVLPILAIVYFLSILRCKYTPDMSQLISIADTIFIPGHPIWLFDRNLRFSFQTLFFADLPLLHTLLIFHLKSYYMMSTHLPTLVGIWLILIASRNYPTRIVLMIFDGYEHGLVSVMKSVCSWNNWNTSIY